MYKTLTMAEYSYLLKHQVYFTSKTKIILEKEMEVIYIYEKSTLN